MNPIAFIAITFGVWIVARGQWPTFWSLATTPNPKGSVLAPSQGTTTTGVAGSQASPATPVAPQGAMSPQQYFAPGYLTGGAQ